MKYTPRLEKPKSTNKYYITKTKGGYSTCIDVSGKSDNRYKDPKLNVLSNCVGYACGRFNEIINQNKQVYALNCNAEDFITRAIKLKLEVGNEPKLGAVIVWAKGQTGKGSDGAGHVEIVEEIKGPNEILTSASGYDTYIFQTKTRKRNVGGTNQWGFSKSNGWTFLGFVYNPAVEDSPVKDLKVLFNKKEYTLKSIIKNEENYVRLRDFDEVLNIANITWDSKKGINIEIIDDKNIYGKGNLKISLTQTKYFNVNNVCYNNENYVRLRDFDETLNIFKVGYDKSKGIPVITM